MRRQVRKVAVLGSGVMGSGIAAHFANAGVPSLVLDIVPRKLTGDEERAGQTLKDRTVRDRIARDSVRAMLRQQPPPLFDPSRAELIEVGNLEDDLDRLAEADWVVEAVKEEMAIKLKLLPEVARRLRADAVLSTNTSGLSIDEMAKALPEEVRPRFLGTHFFNPPRYMRLLEIIPGAHTSAAVTRRISEFAAERLGKGIVLAKDTPNFIANRIGVHALMVTFRVMDDLGLTIEEVDALTGPPLARPKTATFRLADLVGLDTLLHVAVNVRDAVPGDESRDVFEPPPLLGAMVEKGLLGRKSGAGFYRRDKANRKRILTFDPGSGDYREPMEPRLPGLDAVKRIEEPAERLRGLLASEGKTGEAAWRLLAPTLSYSAMRLGEIADDAATLDRALELGFNWELGPFKIWDALGFRPTFERLRGDGYPLPGWAVALYEGGAERLYDRERGALRSPAAGAGERIVVPEDPRAFDFELLRLSGRELRSNESASLIDLGDGVLGLEFHSKMNAIDGKIIEMMNAAADEAEASWQAIVVANDGDSFSAGANLMLLVQAAQAGDWKAIERLVRSFQAANDRLERCGVPVVVAPHGMALGGGCEVVLAGNAVQAAAESYVGLVEVGAGLVPAGGGCMRLYRRHLAMLPDPADLYPALKATFQAIGMAKVSSSAEEARRLGFLRPQDGWTMNRDRRVADAKDRALALAGAAFEPPRPQTLSVMGRDGVAVIESALINMLEGRHITDHDRRIGQELARILSGGDVPGPTRVSEQHLLDLEWESFLRLCGEAKTQERIVALLKTGKPLRN